MTQYEYTENRNPLEPQAPLKSPSCVPDIEKDVHPQSTVFTVDSAITKAEKRERHAGQDVFHESPTKRIKIDALSAQGMSINGINYSERRKGVAPIKPESVL